jgi:ureidoglycolate lyase
VVAVVPITSEAFAPFGDVFEASAGTVRDAVSAQWAVVARERYGSEVAPRALALPARAPELGFIEAHPNSPQLSVAFDSPWILAVGPGIAAGTEVGRDADVSSAQAFLVQPGVGVILRAGLWHGPVTALRPTDALVIFREGVVDEWTELDNPTPLEVPASAQS